MAISTGSSARKVLSSTRPVRTFFSLVRTKAPPLPGLTCWNSTTFIRSPPMFRVMPFFRSLVVGITALLRRRGEFAPPPRLVVRGLGPLQLEKLLGRGGQHVVAAGSDHRQVLDPDAAEAGKVDTRLHGHGRPWRDPTIGTHPHSGGLVAPTRTLGASWISRPMPWPEGWLKASPRPARPITSRQARSTAAPLTPARRAARPAAWARRTTS